MDQPAHRDGARARLRAAHRGPRQLGLDDSRAQLINRFAARFPVDQRTLAAEIISPFLVANSTYNADSTQQAKDDAAARVEPVRFNIIKGQVVVRQGEVIDDLLYERLQALDLITPGSRFHQGRRLVPLLGADRRLAARLGLALPSGVLAPHQRAGAHRPVAAARDGGAAVHRGSLRAALLRAGGGRGAALTVLLDSSVGLLMSALIGIIAASITGLAELGAYFFLASLCGLIVVRRGERLGQFVQAGITMAVVNVAVVSTFTLLGDRDLTGVIQLWGASLASAGGSAVVAVGTFALLGNLFGITTSFQLLELANPSQPLLRRLLMEAPGTYHHSLMVGNLAERAAEAVGADPLVARVAAYYHDVGKLANPVAFIENQGGWRTSTTS